MAFGIDAAAEVAAQFAEDGEPLAERRQSELDEQAIQRLDTRLSGMEAMPRTGLLASRLERLP